MASALTDKLSRLVKTISGQARITESNVADMLREVRMALLEADVALPVVRDFIARVKDKALGQEVMGSLKPGQALVGIVNKELAATMGEGVADINLAAQPPAVILMAGLQGAGKTYDPAVSTTTYRRVSEKSGSAGTVPQANICISAFGRLWVANTATDKVTISFSDLIAGHVWSGGTSGSLDVSRVWPNGADEVMGLAAHNDFLFIFGKRQILVYSGASTPAGIVLSDTVGSIGCIARDTIQSIGSDVVFLSDSGVRSLMRTIQEKSAPLRDLSKNVRFDLNSSLASETLANIKSVYSEKEAFYLLVLPATFQVYCFDTKQSLQDGSSRVTKWDSIAPTCLKSLRNGDLYIGKTGYIGKYDTYLDDTSTYRFAYYTNNADLGNPNQISILKAVTAIVIGGSNQYLTINWGFDYSGSYRAENVYIPSQTSYEYGTAEYNIAEYTSGVPIKTRTANASGAGKIVQTGYETTINGVSFSLQKIEIQAKDGKIG